MDREHEWQPAQGWYARYRCSRCGAFGFKQRIVTVEAARAVGAIGTERVTPYACKARPGGVACGRPAVTKENKVWKCAVHRRDAAIGGGAHAE
jgi:hypothetical protein